MTEQEIVKLLSSIQFNQSLDMASYFIVIICAGIGGWLASYLKEKGKNYAKREDFVSLKNQLEQNTNLIEGIRTQLSEKSWINQQIWVKKQEAYEAIFSSLFHVRKYVAHQVSDHEEWEYVNNYHPFLQSYGRDDADKYFESWERENGAPWGRTKLTY